MVFTNPHDAARVVHLGFAFHLLEGAEKVCVITGKNPKIKASKEIRDKYTSLFLEDVEALDIIDWAKRAVSVGNNPTQ
jgi:hypothetical protein